MLSPSDLPILRRATFQAPVVDSDSEHDSSKRRRRPRPKRAGDAVAPEATVEAAAIDATPEQETVVVDAPVVERADEQAPLSFEVVVVETSATEAEATEPVVPAASAEPEADDAGTADDDAGQDAGRDAGDDGSSDDADDQEAAAPTEGTPSRGGSQPPRHRAERVRNRRAGAGASSGKNSGKSAGKGAGASVRRTAALGSAVAFIGLSAFGAIIPAADAETSGPIAQATTDDLTPASTATIAAATGAAALDSITPAVEAEAAPAITSRLSTAAAPFTGGTQVTVKGRSLDEVASITVGATPATIVAADETEITFQVPAVTEASAGAAVDVTMTATDGDPVDVVTTEAPVSTAASLLSEPMTATATADAQDAATDDATASTATPIGEKAADPLVLTYTTDPAIDAQLGYVLAYWNNYNSAQYPVFSGIDCANFASQSLIARGWAMDGGWFYDGSTGTMSSSWSSSTALRDYLLGQPARATALDDSQRAQVKVGDIAQFDWDSSGDRDHTAVVTRVQHTDAGTKIWVGGHTKDIDYWDVDQALASGGGYVTYFSIH